MGLKKCKECGAAVSTKAVACPSCGAKHPTRKKGLGAFLAILAVLFVGYGFSQAEKNTSSSAPVAPSAVAITTTPTNPTLASSDSFVLVEQNSGCSSKFSEEKKADLFRSLYKDRLMTFRGEIADLHESDLSLKILPGTLFADVQIDLADSKAGYNLHKGSYVTVRFTMRSAGGCLTRFRGDDGVLL